MFHKKPLLRWLLHALASLIVMGGGQGMCATSFLALHPDNPHYFSYRGKPMIIITSGEHYGAVLNLDFDYKKYLRTLESDGMNGTRTWAGAYCEPPTAFNIASNTLAPLRDRFICPWARSQEPGYPNGGNKFDLTKWDPAYFKRLRDFMTEARKRGVIVELNLFCPFYEEGMWKISPMNAANNVNGVGAVSRTNVYTLDKNGGLLTFQEGMVKKLVGELKGFDNLYYEICNEPYFGGVTLEWQGHIADVITAEETRLGVRHLISQNIANGKLKIEKPHREVSIFNFHYASPPDTIAMNYRLNKVIGDNETGFRGTNDAPYRMEAWDFIVAGGGLFNHLDYSFVAGREDGTFGYPASQPGGGNPTLRRQFRFLSEVMAKLDFVRMQPMPDLIKGPLPNGVIARALVKSGQDYLVYARTPGATEKGGQTRHQHLADQELNLSLDLPAGNYVSEWLDTKMCTRSQGERFSHGGGVRKFSAPAFEDDIALLVRQSGR